MFNLRNNSPFGMGQRGNASSGASRYPYQAMPYGYENTQAGSLISKVMLLLSFSFLFAAIGALIGYSLVVNAPQISMGPFLIGAFGGLIVLFILRMAIQVSGLNLFLLYLFTFLEGLSLSPILAIYTRSGLGNILAEAFIMTAVVSLALAVYGWTTKRDFSRLGTYLFFGVILLLVASIIGIFFQGLFSTGFLGLFISIFGVAIFAGYVLYYVQQAKYLADTLPNAIMMTSAIFITVMNLFLYILQLLTILQGNNRRR